ncbi:MAG: UDP-N-acetylglucosamine pyrophosphorylase [Clostridiales bacterium]|nr:UDP-N-acetylglucosamine pyrophosphorylase [Clostridiales bacterium]
MNNYKVKDLFDLNHTLAKPLLEQAEYPWEVLGQIKEFIIQLGHSLSAEEYDEVAENVWIAKTAKIAPTAFINGPAIIGKNTEVRHCAFIRGSALVGEDAVVGNSTELKNVILFDRVQVPHYNYVGDSILGYHAHMGAGSITSNIKADQTSVTIRFPETIWNTGLRKMGAMLGDWVDIGCNSVLNPGTIIGPHTNVYPLSMVRGAVAAHSIYKKAGEVVEKQ